jgi:tetraacyldisaccharide 4'-kinase
VLITRADAVSRVALAEIRQTISTFTRSSIPMLDLAFEPHSLSNAFGDQRPLSEPTRARSSAVAFCGIGNPQAFQQTLLRLGVIGRLTTFPDHHHYAAADLDQLEQQRQQAGASMVITTWKDLVKLPLDHPLTRSTWAIDQTVTWRTDPRPLQAALERIVPFDADHTLRT